MFYFPVHRATMAEPTPKLAERQAEVDAFLEQAKEQPPVPLKTIVSKPPLRWTSDPWCLLGLFAGSVLLGYTAFTVWRWVMAPTRTLTNAATRDAVQGLQQQALEFARRIAAGASEVDQILSAAASNSM